MSVTATDCASAIAQLLLASALAPLVKNSIRPLNAATTDRRPFVTYQAVETEEFEHMTGTASWSKMTLQLDFFSDDYATAQSLLAAAKTELKNFSGSTGDVTIGICRHKSDSDETELPDIGEEQPIIRLQSNYLVIYQT